MPMITHEHQLIEGGEFWYVYGHLPLEQPRKIQVLSEVMVQPNYKFVHVTYDKDGPFEHDGKCHLSDVGIGANYNMNRLFDTQEEAEAFWHSSECVAYRQINPWTRRDHDSYNYGYARD